MEPINRRSAVLVDGQVSPTVRARPGEREHYRVVNACASRFLSLRMEGMPPA